MKMLRLLLVIPPLLMGCARTYYFTDNLKLFAYESNVSSGKLIGPMQGQDCVYAVLGYWFGTPKLETAFANARIQTDGVLLASSDEQGNSNWNTARYLNNVKTKDEGYSFGLFGKDCIVVRGVGYK